MSVLTLYSREGCGLCEELALELGPWARSRGLALEVLDVDADPDARRRYGHRVPVVLLAGETLAEGRVRLDALDGEWRAAGGGRAGGTRLV